MVKRTLLIICLILCALSSRAQRDTVVTTMLREVAVVGEKGSASTMMSASTIVDAAETQRLNIATMRGVSEIAPNFYIPAYGSRMTSTIYVRGLGARIDQPVVGLNVDGVTYLNKDNYDFDLFDIAKIEVLRGAQSILNGRNTMGGQVNILTLSPWSYQGWRLMAEYGRANSVKAGVGYYGRLSSTLASSVTAYLTTTDGYFRNAYNGGRLDTERQGALRWKASWHPSPRLSVTNTASAIVSRQGGYPYESLATGTIAYNDTCFYRRTSIADGLTIGWSSKRVVVTSETSVQYIDDNMTLDQDFMPLEYFTLTQKKKEYALTEDLYAKGRRGNYRWLGGVFAFYKHNDMQAPVTFKPDGIANLIVKYPNQMNPSYPIEWRDPSFVLGSDFLYITKGLALYQQSTYALGQWDFELGLRWDVERSTLMYESYCDTGYYTWHLLDDGSRELYRDNDLVINEHGHLSRTFAQLLPKLAVGYTFASSGTRVYASAAKGYKAGGFNSQMFSDVLQQQIMALMGVSMKYDADEIVGYKPEKSWNYELGVKTSLLNSRLDLDGTLFYISCTDQQLTAFPDGLTTGRIMTNAGRTRSFGFEATARLSLSEQWAMRASYGYTNATFRHYFDGKADYRGKRLPYAPSNTAFAGVTYTVPAQVLGASLELDLNARGIGDIYWDEANLVRQPFYVLLGASAALTHQRWSLRLWGENIANTRYTSFYFVSIGNAFVQRGNPWSAGATLRVNI